ncbi:hypothetical protein SLEP1_g35063 [Rubroshorea leprosula]|uniref:Uncharacterized protein n=1 Tax=Rubroshorea leprosula TaxID=152421 RepID=A0AAV5KM22_9ROSI|nr:hypothetical protein SLEP1_g35063 [Rubroshorea leprosula]
MEKMGRLEKGLRLRGRWKQCEFLNGRMVGDGSVANKFPRLLWLSAGKDKKMNQMGTWDNGEYVQPTVYREPQLDIKKLRDPEEFFERHYYELTPFHVCHAAAQERTGAVFMDWDLNNPSMSERSTSSAVESNSKPTG